MKAKPACLPCCLTRMLRLATEATDNEWLLNRVLDEMMVHLKKRQHDNTPAELVTELYQQATKMLGDHDPYLQKKKALLDELLDAEDDFRSAIESSKKPMKLAVRLSCIANIFDDDLLQDYDYSALFNQAEDIRLQSECWESFVKDVKNAKTLLFIHQSTGELIFDKLFMACLPDKQWISVVQASPILNAATLKEAEKAGLDSVTSQIIAAGERGLGLSLNDMSGDLKDLYESADCVIVKGQPNYENLSGADKLVYALFRVKCQVMGDKLGMKTGEFALERC